MPKNRVSVKSDGRWSYSVTDASGKRHYLDSRKGELKPSFWSRCDKLDREIENGTSDLTFDDLFRLWVEEHVKINLSPSELRITIPCYERHVAPYLGSKKISSIKRPDVYKVLSRANKAGLAASTIKHIRGCISRPYNWAINAMGLPIVSPTQGLRFKAANPGKNKGSRFIKPKDAERIFLAAANSKYLNYLQVLYLTGLRPSEGLGLQICDIKPDHLEIRRAVTLDGLSDLKNSNARRDLPLYPQLREVLHHQIAESRCLTPQGWLFPSKSNIPSMNAAINALKNILKNTAEWKRGGHNGLKKLKLIRPALKYSLYDFRHTFATRMAEAGMQQIVLQKLMGHEDISTTLKFYVEVTDKMVSQAVDLMSRSI